MIRHFCKCAGRSRSLTPVVKRHIFGYPLTPSYALSRLQRQVADMEREMDRWMGGTTAFFARPDWPMTAFRPFRVDNPYELESYRLHNPIVEEDGKHIFKLQFDVRRFKPEEVNISTNSKDGMLTIEAKHEDENSKFAFTKKISIPAGVDIKGMSCHYDEEGLLSIRAPYTPPETVKNIAEPRKPQDIPIKHA